MNRLKLTLGMLLLGAPLAFGHEAGSHAKVMGTVRSIDERNVVVKTTDGKERSITLDDETQCLGDPGDTACSSVKAGDRVIVTRRGKDGVADEIRFSSKKEKAPHDHGQHDHGDGHSPGEENE